MSRLNYRSVVALSLKGFRWRRSAGGSRNFDSRGPVARLPVQSLAISQFPAISHSRAISHSPAISQPLAISQSCSWPGAPSYQRWRSLWGCDCDFSLSRVLSTCSLNRDNLNDAVIVASDDFRDLGGFAGPSWAGQPARNVIWGPIMTSLVLALGFRRHSTRPGLYLQH